MIFKDKSQEDITTYIENPRWLNKAHILSASALGFCAFMVLFMPWQQTSYGQGRVIAFSPFDRVQSITATVEGRIENWFVNEGQKVKAGDPLLKIVDNDPEILNRLSAERSAVASRLKALDISVDTAYKNISRQKSLFEKGLSSERQYELSRLDYQKAVADRANVEAELVRLDTRIARQKTQSIQAPREGIVQKIVVSDSSRIVKPGEELATLVPATSERTVELYISGMDLPFVVEKQKVLLVFEGWPSIQFSGWPQASVGTYQGEVKLVDPADSGTGQFRVLVGPDGSREWPTSEILKQGVRVRGYIQLMRVPLWFEVWRRLNGFPNSLPKEQADKVMKKSDSDKESKK